MIWKAQFYTLCEATCVWFFSANGDGVKQHASFSSIEQKRNFFQGTKKEFYAFLIDCFSLLGSVVLDMTDYKARFAY